MRTYRILAISDIHMSNKLPQAQLVADGATDRLNDQLALWERVHAAAREHRVNRTLVLGDLFDKSLVDAVTLTSTIEAIMASPSPVDILPGNHDAISTQGGRFTVEAFGKMGAKRVRYIGGAPGEPLEVDGWLRFWPIEYCNSNRAVAAITSIREGFAKSGAVPTECLLLHHSIVGCSHLGWTCDDGLDADWVTEGFDHVFSGHFHEHQRFGLDGRGMYLGAPMHHRMDDEGREAGFWVIEFNDEGGREEQWLDGGAPKMHTALWQGSAAKTTHAAAPGDYLRVVVEATHAEWTTLRAAVMEYISRLKGEGIRATFKHRPLYHHEVRLEPSEVGEKLSMDEMSDAYVDSADVATGGLDTALLKRLGRRALEEARRRA